MTFLAIPNVSEGKDPARIASMKAAVESHGCRVLDIHSDGVHHRSVFTVAGAPADLPRAMAALAAACDYIDLTRHDGLHPRLGRLDVCPIVPVDEPRAEALEVARETGRAIHARTRVPIYLYGQAATREQARELPDLRRGGLEALIRRATTGFPPDLGGPEIDPRSGVVCVGVRDVLIAFNVWLRADRSTTSAIARRVRTSGGGPPGIRALGIPIDDKPTAQVSMNLVDPAITGIDAAFELVAAEAKRHACEIVATEIVGVVPNRFRPDPHAQVARLLIEPGHSLEELLAR